MSNSKPQNRAGRSKGGKSRLPTFRNTEEFLALSDADKEKVWRYYNREIPLSETRPMTKAEREQWQRMRRRWAAREKARRVSKTISVSMEKNLLKRADAYANRYGLTRGDLIEMSLKEFMRSSDGNTGLT